MKIEKFDITSAYLNGDLEEIIFMEILIHLSEILKDIEAEEDGEVGGRPELCLMN